jgi:hypothetical protein
MDPVSPSRRTAANRCDSYPNRGAAANTGVDWAVGGALGAESEDMKLATHRMIFGGQP